MQITNEMVEAARDSLTESNGRTYFPSNHQIRAALEAALRANEPKCDSDLLKHLHITAELTAQGMKNSKPEDYLEGKAAACIEDLAAALKEVISVSDRATDIYDRARATLERWGLK